MAAPYFAIDEPAYPSGCEGKDRSCDHLFLAYSSQPDMLDAQEESTYCARCQACTSALAMYLTYRNCSGMNGPISPGLNHGWD